MAKGQVIMPNFLRKRFFSSIAPFFPSDLTSGLRSEETWIQSYFDLKVVFYYLSGPEFWLLKNSDSAMICLLTNTPLCQLSGWTINPNCIQNFSNISLNLLLSRQEHIDAPLTSKSHTQHNTNMTALNMHPSSGLKQHAYCYRKT